MNRSLLLCCLIPLIFTACKTAEKEEPKKLTEPVADLFIPALAPFYHGVASGDPLTDRVILWTRVTPEDSVASVAVVYEISDSKEFTAILKADSAKALAEKDYTVKVDVVGLQPGTTYYYRFHALGKSSGIGRTKTLPEKTDSVKLAIVSCANWEFGYFNPYDKIADRTDVDAIVHLGDYIYEYKSGGYGDTTIGRFHLPGHEIVSLSDYRTRHSQYRLDKGLRRVSQQHPMISIWDDHEIANDSYTKGAQNHQPEEGDYEKRKNAAKQAYYEWLPIREGEKHYRSFSYGTLADLIMLDERLEGRTKPVDSLTDPTFYNDDRAILGGEQLAWLQAKLSNSKATWKILGNQAMFSDVLQTPEFRNKPRNFDSWDGYPAEKNKLLTFIQVNKIKDLIFVTGDTHASWAIEVPTKNYNPKTSQGAIAIELGTTSISSGNDDDRKPTEVVKQIEIDMMELNPHIKYFNDRDHGYLLLTLYPDKAKGEWFYVETLRQPETREYLAKKVEISKGSVKLK